MPINLLPQDLQKKQEHKRQQKTADIISVLILIILIVSLGVLFAYRVVVVGQANEISTSLGEVRIQIEKQKVVEGTLKAIHLKLNQIREALTQRLPYGDILGDLSEYSGQRIEITKISVKKKDQFEITGKTDSLTQIAEFMNRIETYHSEYRSLSVDKISFNDNDYTYQFNLSFAYSPKL